MTALEASHESRKPVIRCPYCIEGGGFKVMIGQGGGDWYMCARCGHLTLPTDPVFECTCAKCAELKSVRENWCRPVGTRSLFPPYPALPCRAITCRRFAAGFWWCLFVPPFSQKSGSHALSKAPRSRLLMTRPWSFSQQSDHKNPSPLWRRKLAGRLGR
jgi:DNA-directed RNA polymerase subunit RPC12/RpoP